MLFVNDVIIISFNWLLLFCIHKTYQSNIKISGVVFTMKRASNPFVLITSTGKMSKYSFTTDYLAGRFIHNDTDDSNCQVMSSTVRTDRDLIVL